MPPPRKRRLSISDPTEPAAKRTAELEDISEEELASALHLLATHNDHGVRSIGVILEAILAIIMPEDAPLTTTTEMDTENVTLVASDSE